MDQQMGFSISFLSLLPVAQQADLEARKQEEQANDEG